MALLGTTTATDPVCGTVVHVARAAAAAEYRGVELFFCSGGCGAAFVADPGRFALGTAAGSEPERSFPTAVAPHSR